MRWASRFLQTLERSPDSFSVGLGRAIAFDPDTARIIARISAAAIESGARRGRWSQSNEVESATVTKTSDVGEFPGGLDTWLTGAPSRIEFWGESLSSTLRSSKS